MRTFVDNEEDATYPVQQGVLFNVADLAEDFLELVLHLGLGLQQVDLGVGLGGAHLGAGCRRDGGWQGSKKNTVRGSG